MPRVTHVKKARKAIPGTDIKVGDSYYWWKFRGEPLTGPPSEQERRHAQTE